MPLSVAAFGVFGGLGLSLNQMDAGDFIRAPGWILLFIQICGTLAMKYGAVAAFPAGGVVGLLVRTIDGRVRSTAVSLMMGGGMCAIAAALVTGIARLFAKTDPYPSDGYDVSRLHTDWILWGALFAGLFCGGWFGYRIALARRRAALDQPPPRPIWPWAIAFGLCLVIAYAVLFALWKTVPIYYEFIDL